MAAADLLLHVGCRLFLQLVWHFWSADKTTRDRIRVCCLLRRYLVAPLRLHDQIEQQGGCSRPETSREQRNKGSHHLGRILNAVSEAVGQMNKSLPGPF